MHSFKLIILFFLIFRTGIFKMGEPIWFLDGKVKGMDCKDSKDSVWVSGIFNGSSSLFLGFLGVTTTIFDPDVGSSSISYLLILV